MPINKNGKNSLIRSLKFLAFSFTIILTSLLSALASQYSFIKVERCSVYEMRSIEGFGPTKCQKSGFPFIVGDIEQDFLNFSMNWLFYLLIWVGAVIFIRKLVKRDYIVLCGLGFVIVFLLILMAIYPFDFLAE